MEAREAFVPFELADWRTVRQTQPIDNGKWVLFIYLFIKENTVWRYAW